MDLSSEVITPDWDHAKVYDNGLVSTMEIPLVGDVYQSGLYKRKVMKNTFVQLQTNVVYSLIIQYSNATENYNAFVTTMLGRNDTDEPGNLSFFDTEAFTGYSIISDLEGNYQKAYLYERGKGRQVSFARNVDYEALDSSQIVGSVHLSKTPKTALYSRSGESPWEPEEPYPDICSKCGSSTCDGNCDVVINRCNDCGQNPCVCAPSFPCPWCGKENCGGNCQVCQKCGSINCDGDCDIVTTYCGACGKPIYACICSRCDECGNFPCNCDPKFYCTFCGEENCAGECRICEYCHHVGCEGDCEERDPECSKCGYPESQCKCCGRCDSYPCKCCAVCKDYPCKCCKECDSYPCICCPECEHYPCECPTTE